MSPVRSTQSHLPLFGLARALLPVVVAATYLGACSSVVSGATFITLTSDPLDWVVPQGGTYTYTPADGSITAKRLSEHEVNVEFTSSDDQTNFSFFFAAPLRQSLSPGIYEAATRWPFQSPTSPGLDVSGNARGCNTVAGRFTVLAATYGKDGSVETFAADFEQHCEASTVTALFGSIRFNSAIDVEPRISVASAAVYDWDGSPKTMTFWFSLTARATGPVSVQYATTDATATDGFDYTAASGEITFAPGETTERIDIPISGDGVPRPSRFFRFDLSQSLGAPVAFGNATGTIEDEPGGRHYISLDSDPDDYVGDEQHMTLTPVDGDISIQTVGGAVLVHFQGAQGINGNGPWDLDFAARGGAPLVPGVYDLATRYLSEPSPVRPTFDVYGEGRGSDIVTGRFVVLEVELRSDGEVTKFAADFELHSEGFPPALLGSVRYNSLIPIEPRLSVSPASAHQNFRIASTLTFWISLSVRATSPVSISYFTVDDTAKSGVDYRPAAGTVTFQPGQTSIPVLISVPPSRAPHPDLRLFMVLSHPEGAPVAFDRAEGTIVSKVGITTYITLQSDPSDWVGAGQHLLLWPFDAVITTEPLPSGVIVGYETFDSGWVFPLTAPIGQTLALGNYSGAHRFATEESPGMDIAGEGRGCDDTTGSFSVLELEYGKDGAVTRFSADFEQHCEGQPAALRGSIRYNSSFPLQATSITVVPLLPSPPLGPR